MEINDISKRCQSCGMPLETGDRADKGFYGTNADGTMSRGDCRFCFSLGALTEPQLVMDEMVKKSVSHMVRVLRLPEVKAKEVAAATIPKLKRWRKD